MYGPQNNTQNKSEVFVLGKLVWEHLAADPWESLFRGCDSRILTVARVQETTVRCYSSRYHHGTLRVQEQVYWARNHGAVRYGMILSLYAVQNGTVDDGHGTANGTIRCDNEILSAKAVSPFP